MTAFINAMFAQFRQSIEARRAIRELQAHTDRELEDIGILRADIKRIVQNGYKSA